MREQQADLQRSSAPPQATGRRLTLVENKHNFKVPQSWVMRP